jgi:hypothetical protein
LASGTAVADKWAASIFTPEILSNFSPEIDTPDLKIQRVSEQKEDL